MTNERGKPVDRASVIVKFVSGRSLKALGLKKARLSWELKSSQEGMAKIPGIPKGKILIQINAKNYQTFGDTFDIDEDERWWISSSRIPSRNTRFTRISGAGLQPATFRSSDSK